MAIAQKLKAFLDEARVPYTTATHPVVYTAQEIAAAQHIPGRQLAKCVLVTTNRGPALAVLSAIYRVDLKRLKAVAGATTLTLATEADIKARFPDVEVGAMPPCGNLYGVPVVVDRALSESETITFNAGTHTDTVSMRYQDFARLVQPTVGAFGQPVSGPARRAKAPRARRPAARRSARRAVTRTTKRKARRKPAARRR